MTRSNAREVAVHMIYELGFGSRSAEELLEHEMTPGAVRTAGGGGAPLRPVSQREAAAVHPGSGTGGLCPRAGAG